MVDTLNIVDYNFQEFTDKDMFAIKLKDVIPNFGYITYTKRKPFFKFCIEHKFLNDRKQALSNHHKNAHLCDVLIDFRFEGMLDYGPKPIIFIANQLIIVLPSYKMHNLKKCRTA